jgi:type I restriction enzyme M protein
MEEIARQYDYKLNISRYITTAEPEQVINLGEVHQALDGIEHKIGAAFNKHNQFLQELRLPLLPQ